MADLKHYAIRGGVQGRERLKLLSRVMHESTAALFDRAGITEGMKCLDIGCGSGDVTFELERRVGPKGKAVGADIDSTKLDLCRADAHSLNIGNVEFRMVDIREHPERPEFDLVHALLPRSPQSRRRSGHWSAPAAPAKSAALRM